MPKFLRILCCFFAASVPMLSQTAPAANPPIQHLSAEAAAAMKNAQAVAIQTKSGARPAAQTLYSHGDPTNDEQQLLEYINRARMHPAAEGDSLYNTTDPDVVNDLNYWKVDKAGVRTAFKGYPVRPPLAFHPKAINAARAHSADMRDKQYQGHTGSDGSDPGARMTKAGYVVSAWGENVFAYTHSMWEAEVAFLVDWGNPDLGHRHNRMNFDAKDEIWSEIGIGVYQASGSVGPYVVTEDFGIRGEHYITGVVYRDKNKNGQYDAGEGVSGVTITPSTGSYYAVSSSSGGYAIPMGNATGTVFVTTSGAGFSDSKAVTLPGNANVKLDFTGDGLPIVVLSKPDDQSMVSTDTTHLIWNKVSTATMYHVQLSKTSDFKKFVVNDSAVAAKDTTYALKSLQSDSTYYWRVRVRTSVGWGDWVPPYQFTVAVMPSAVKLTAPATASKLKDKNITFTWTASTPGVVKYWLEIARDSAYYDHALDNYDVPSTSWALDDPDGNIVKDVKYYWHVAGFHNDNVQGPFSPSNWFIISDAPNAVNEDKDIIINTLAPNPVQGLMQLQFTLKQAATVQFSLCNERGDVVATLPAQTLDAGDHSTSFDFSQAPLSTLGTGTYFLHFNNGTSMNTRKLVLTR